MATLELLAPAKDLACGMAAIDHGADAVYIGAPRFGARAAAGNSVADIASLCRYAHQYGANVYVTVNTIVYDDELHDTLELLANLADAGVDAILVQDMGLIDLTRQLPQGDRLILHASTQTDNRTAEKVAWLAQLGFRRVVLARELAVEEIAEIHRRVPNVELEVFVHGALCVSYSGLCYASQHCFGRSANRGECAQFCRMKFNLTDANGKLIEREKYLLSLKDLCQYDHLEELAAAGATSFKIEGRLKDVAYVKNVTAAYSQRLNEIVEKHHGKYCRASRGRVRLSFQPDLNKTFNRGYTTYFLHGRQPGIASFLTPKAMGEYVGYVKEIHGNYFTVAGVARFANGDGLCYIGDDNQLVGFRVNRADRNCIYPLQLPASLRTGMKLYRNNDQEFERTLSRPTAERKIPVALSLRPTENGFNLTLDDVSISVESTHQLAQTPQLDNIRKQLSKLGGTPYVCTKVDIPDDFPYFIPSSLLAQWRRQLVEVALGHATGHRERTTDSSVAPMAAQSAPSYGRGYLYNIANSKAQLFYQQHGLSHPDPAFDLQKPASPLIMQCRHCLRYSLGFCKKNGGRLPAWREPLTLSLADGRHFRLEFDCRHCQMNVYAD